MRTLLAGLLSGVLLTVGVIAEQAAPGADAAMKAYQSAWNKGEIAALGALYAENALHTVATGNAEAGRTGIQKRLGGLLAGEGKGSQISLTAARTLEVKRDVVVQEGTFELTQNGGKQQGRFVATLVQEEGAWKIAALVIMN